MTRFTELAPFTRGNRKANASFRLGYSAAGQINGGRRDKPIRHPEEGNQDKNFVQLMWQEKPR
jgi:hypothetical protein